MKKHPIQNVAELYSLTPRSYSGRGMYGKTCLGVVVENQNSFISLIMENIDDENLEDIADKFLGMKIDNIGRDYIIYFPNIEYVASNAEIEKRWTDFAQKINSTNEVKQNSEMKWTLLWDVHSGGVKKIKPYNKIYIQAPENEAIKIFKDKLSHRFESEFKRFLLFWVIAVILIMNPFTLGAVGHLIRYF